MFGFVARLVRDSDGSREPWRLDWAGPGAGGRALLGRVWVWCGVVVLESISDVTSHRENVCGGGTMGTPTFVFLTPGTAALCSVSPAAYSTSARFKPPLEDFRAYE